VTEIDVKSKLSSSTTTDKCSSTQHDTQQNAIRIQYTRE